MLGGQPAQQRVVLEPAPESAPGAASAFAGGGFLVPTRNGELFRWCLRNEMRLIHQLTLMTIGLYNEPAGAYLPSVLY